MRLKSGCNWAWILCTWALSIVQTTSEDFPRQRIKLVFNYHFPFWFWRESERAKDAAPPFLIIISKIKTLKDSEKWIRSSRLHLSHSFSVLQSLLFSSRTTSSKENPRLDPSPNPDFIRIFIKNLLNLLTNPENLTPNLTRMPPPIR